MYILWSSPLHNTVRYKSGLFEKKLVPLIFLTYNDKLFSEFLQSLSFYIDVIRKQTIGQLIFNIEMFLIILVCRKNTRFKNNSEKEIDNLYFDVIALRNENPR